MRVALALCCLAIAGLATAAEPYSCRNGSFPSRLDVVAAGRIADSAGSRVHFRNDDAGCPEAAACVQKAYLVPGDKVLTAQRDGAWICAWYFGKRREYVGWLPVGAVVHQPPPPSVIDDWVGTWTPIAGENEIVIRRDPASKGLSAEGTALLLGVEFPDGSRNVHFGEFSGKGRPAADRWTVGNPDEEHDCVVDMRLVAGRLVVHDNANCGGMNVRFDDIYRKSGPAPAPQAKGR